MCGVIAVVSSEPIMLDQLKRAEHIQIHRGPDSQGIHQCFVRHRYVSLCHQRLSILDLSHAGAQPMHLHSGNSGWLVFNGEIYNYLEIRKELIEIGWVFNSNSDTEVLLAALNQWQLDDAINRLNGMWAFAWLDDKNGRLVVSRDRFGVKPLYYHMDNNTLVFASEIKTILELLDHKVNVNANVVNTYIQDFLFESSDDTFFEGISKVPSGTFSIIDLNSDVLAISFHAFWRAKSNITEEKSLVLTNKTDDIRELFYDAVNLRLRSDVPLGVFLSGGVDSSAIAVAMQNILGKDANLSLLSAVSNDPNFDESKYIDVMASHLKKQVHKVNLGFSPEKARRALEQVTWHNDEPCGGFSNVAQYQLIEKAQELGIKVLLSGQGADEAFCGYKKYVGFYAFSLMHKKQYIAAIRLIYGFLKNGTVIKQFNWGEAKRYLPRMLQPDRVDIRGECLLDICVRSSCLGMGNSAGVAERQWLDVYKFSIPRHTHYEDRMAMALSSEIRNPFLDYRLMEAAVCVPANMKLHNGWTKYIFRKAMEPYMPDVITWRKDKMGFSNPESEWLKTSLSELVNDYFGEESLIFKCGFIKRNALLKLYDGYKQQPPKSGRTSFWEIWAPLSIEIWLRQFSKYLKLDYLSMKPGTIL